MLHSKASIRIFVIAIISSVFLQPTHANDSDLSTNVRIKEFSLSKKSLALKGYDPTSYFDNSPQKGSKKITYTHAGVTYHFVTQKNLETFKAAPSSFEPQYGGWCAWAMYDGGGRTEANPESYKIIDDKLYVFYDGLWGDTLKLWNDELKSKAESQLINTANQYWKEQLR